MKLVVIGGGMAGLFAIANLRKLDKKQSIEIVLIEPKDFMEVVWCAYRSPFEEWVANGSTFLLDQFCKDKNVQHVRSIVTKMTSTEVVLDDESTIAFDAALIATGASIDWSGMGNGLPQDYNGSREERLRILKESGQKLLNAKSVLIVGGGLIGTELAADLAAYSKKAGKDVKVTLVHAHDHLCPEFRERPARTVEANLAKLGVHIVLNDKAVEKNGQMVLQSDGTVLDAEQVVRVVGLVAKNGFLEIPGALNERGFVDTDDCFLVKGTSNVFAFGDCCTTLDNAGSAINWNKAVVAHNLKAALEGKTDALKKASVQPGLTMVTTGPDGGVLQTGCCHTQWLLPSFKNSTMLLSIPKSELGFK